MILKFSKIQEVLFFIICACGISQGRESSLRSKILDSDITLNIAKHESELTMRLNCAAHDGDLYRLSRIIGAGADPSRTDYDGRSPLVSISSFCKLC